MLMEKERQEIVDYGKKMSSAGLSKGTSGNISAYDPVCGYMAISPSGLDYFETAAEDIVILDLDGNLIEGSRKPSSEHALHATIYKLHPDARGVVHAHSTYCTTFACLKQPIEAVHYLLAGAQTSCVPCADYATYGTEALAEKVSEATGKDWRCCWQIMVWWPVAPLYQKPSTLRKTWNGLRKFNGVPCVLENRRS